MRLAACVDTAEVWFDGACSGNPGPMGAGAVVRFLDQTDTLSEHRGRGTNNEAEYGGLILGLRRAKELGADAVVVRGDSELIIRQLEGRYAVKAANLRPLFEEAKALLAGFQRVELKWIRRDRNAAADAAARDAVAPS